MATRNVLRLGLLLLAPVLALGCAAEGTDDGSADSAFTEQATWSHEQGLADRFKRSIEPSFMTDAKRGEFVGVDGIKVRYAELPAQNEKAAVVIFTGRTESYVKYAEVASDLHRHGYSLYLIDHRGQGFSDRMLPDSDKGYVKDFSDYVTDAETFVDRVVAPKQHKRLFALGHSMGGAILAKYVLKHPSTFRGVVFSAPMFKIQFPKFVLGEFGVGVLNIFKGDTDYVVGKGPYKEGRRNAYNHSDVRFGIFYDGLEREFPHIRLGGATKQWLFEAIQAGEDIQAHGRDFKPPMLLLEGEVDEIVDNAGADIVCKAAPSCARMAMPGGGHELFMERDDLRDRALDALVGFVDSH